MRLIPKKKKVNITLATEARINDKQCNSEIKSKIQVQLSESRLQEEKENVKDQALVVESRQIVDKVMEEEDNSNTSQYGSRRQNKREANKKKIQESDNHNGEVIKNNENLGSFARRFITIFIKKFFDESNKEKTPYLRPPRSQLYGTSTVNEHYQRIEWVIRNAKGKSGLDGLNAIGFEYKVIACSKHSDLHGSNNSSENDDLIVTEITENIADLISFPLHEQYNEQRKLDNDQNVTLLEQEAPISVIYDNNKEDKESVIDVCMDCCSRLYHIESDTMITFNNRHIFIADGDMYEEVVRLCQDVAQDLIQKEASLHWVSICEDSTKGNPIRALVHEDYKENMFSPESDVSTDSEGCVNQRVLPNTLLITTGRGKVRAGIFSRQHLLISGIEKGSCLGSVREAHKRGMKVVILDPNARGERNGMSTYEQCMHAIFRGKVNQTSIDESNCNGQCKQNSSLHVFSHSASGSQLTRYLTHDGSYLMRHLRSVAFTDSNHSIQWLKNNIEVSSFLQSPSSLYVRSANEYRDYDWEKRVPGELCETDHLWKHRFGDIQTIWAGTKDHSLSNWTAHSHIWEHFDKYLGSKNIKE